MSEIKISIELRIEAASESAARQYASAQGIDVDDGKWYPNRDGNGGRLYATSTTPFSGLPQQMRAGAIGPALANSADIGAPIEPGSPEPGTCGSSGLVNKFCDYPVHKILHRGTNYSEWQCESCGALLRTTWD